MGLLDFIFPRSKAMPDQAKKPDDITRLRKASYSLEDLPETINFPLRKGEPQRAPLALLDATVDDIAFAIIAAESECSAAVGRASALRRLHTLAREAGCRGTDRATDVVLNKGVRK